MTTPKCMKCSGAMEEGYILEATNGAEGVATWIRGAPERLGWRGLNTGGKARMEVASFRCVSCGFLESYARPKST
ncbi:hypothetical protein TA3x_000706 [Tundrisphaera sp. TA3]|uniref:hypothetical protein n=1 Tax=Tundrisphaera sp. TA3 TaxID=3435775 RepID=UPI003EBB0425